MTRSSEEVPGTSLAPSLAEVPGTSRLNTWLEVSERAYGRNLRFFRDLVGPEVELAVVVKANAYGHDARLVAGLAPRYGADSFCVHSLEEALDLRQAGIRRDVLVMGPVPPARLADAVDADLRLVLFDRETARGLAARAAEAGRRARVHLKIETGTYRQGIDDDELDWFVEFLRGHPELEPEGVYTHFANIEDTTRHDFAQYQLHRFSAALERLAAAGIAPPKRHAACSAAILAVPSTRFAMVRLGISQYGMWPSKETFLSYRLDHGAESETALEPVLTWKTRIGQLKWVPADRSIGYGRSYHTTRRTRIAILPVGYSDGYDRKLSNQAHVLVRGRRAPVRGRVCMNLTMVDVTDLPEVERGDEVVLLGRQGEEAVTADHLAALAGTINYEITSRINPALPRFVV